MPSNSRPFANGTVICHYNGTLYEGKAARLLKKESYEQNKAQYVYEIGEWQGKFYVIDATKDDNSQGRVINHGIHPNIKPKPKTIDGQLYLLFHASRDIEQGEEIVYDYGQRPSADRCDWLGTCPLPSCLECLK